MAQDVLITKADGEREPFDPAKLERSLEHAGASSTMRARVLSHVMRELKSGMTTSEIYRHAFDILRREEEVPVAARYSMKRAVLDLGPSGFPFERFLAQIMRTQGWRARTDLVLTGRCAQHEVDVLAEKNGKRVGIEAKFHNEPSGKTDIKDALYVKARYEDLSLAPDPRDRVTEGWLVTNTRFTTNAIRYAQCSNLTLIGWDFPQGLGLQQMIEEARVHPLTALTTLSPSQKQQFLRSNIVLCRSIQDSNLLREYGVKPAIIPQVLQEAQRLCGVDTAL